MSTDFELSRIYAQGWNAAAKLTPAQNRVLKSRGTDALNPHTGAAERARWAEGFDKALGHSNSVAPHHTSSGSRRVQQ